MSDNSQLELIREAANRPPYKQVVYVNAGQLLAEIEREYLEMPILESEPLKVGDKVDGYNQNGAEVVAVMNSKMVVVRSTVKGGNGYHDEAYPLLLWSVDELKRPEPEVLDADGVPIRVGDHIWCKPGVHYDGIEYVVTRVTETRVSYRNAEGEFPRGNCTHEFASSNITHKQPDSLERIEDDALMDVCDYFGTRDEHKCDGCRGAYCFECKHEMTLDLLRRQREVLERER